MSKADIAVAVYDSHTQAEEAVHKLAKAGFDMKTISILGKDYHTEENVVGYFNAGDRARFFGKLGAFWGGLAGVLFGSALMFVPVVGHIVVLGPIAATIAGGLQGAVLGGGVSALVGALTAIGVPKDSVLRYETALKASKFLVIVHGGGDDVRRAHDVLASAGSSDVQTHAGQE
ncbi:general stress protein [Piscinibacter defluvii]|uniref:general stress protein n=1 Tax=Piscinibacter defluvii TaxID=1796922 RepID=UPI000FDD570A|nr:general stress protein [Piscinibacter defluvii]